MCATIGGLEAQRRQRLCSIIRVTEPANIPSIIWRAIPAFFKLTRMAATVGFMSLNEVRARSRKPPVISPVGQNLDELYRRKLGGLNRRSQHAAFALNAGLCFRRGRLPMVFSSLQHHAAVARKIHTSPCSDFPNQLSGSIFTGKIVVTSVASAGSKPNCRRQVKSWFALRS
jgi:hypothetical protein